MPTHLTGVSGRKLINFPKHASMSRSSSTENPMKKLIILPAEERVSSVCKGRAGMDEQHQQRICHCVIKD